jgi:hypothetical protein
MKPSLVLTLMSLAVAGAAVAQTPGRPGAPPMRESVRKACEKDAQSVCAGKQERELSLCLLGNLQRLSTTCRDALGQPTAAQQRPPPQPAPKSPE